LEPTVAAHLPVAMTDLPLALALGVAAVAAALLASGWRWRWAIACGVAMGLALAAKHSALAGLAGLGLLLVLAAQTGWKHGAREAGGRRRARVRAAVVGLWAALPRRGRRQRCLQPAHGRQDRRADVAALARRTAVRRRTRAAAARLPVGAGGHGAHRRRGPRPRHAFRVGQGVLRPSALVQLAVDPGSEAAVGAARPGAGGTAAGLPPRPAGSGALDAGDGRRRLRLPHARAGRLRWHLGRRAPR